MGETMNDADGFTLSRPWSASRFDRLRQLLQQIAIQVNGIEITETALLKETSNERLRDSVQHFVVVAAPQFSVLLQANPWMPHNPALQTKTPTAYHVSLEFQPETIAAFLDHLLPQMQQEWQLLWTEARSDVQPNDMKLQTEFTRRLLDLLLEPSTSSILQEEGLQEEGDATATAIDRQATRQTACELALQQQVEQERLLNQVTIQIRQSLELPMILQTAVDQVQECLQVDRLVIYQLDPPAHTAERSDLSLTHEAIDRPSSLEQSASQPGGSVVYEARASEVIPSVLHFSDTHCFIEELRGQSYQTWTFPLVVEDVVSRYQTAVPCLLDFLRRAQIRAKLVVPIWVHDRLWGFLCAHDCTTPHAWEEREQRFLQQTAEHLAIAIQQAQLYSELQQQKQNLEQRVVERTQALQDTMLAAQAASRAKSEFLAAVSHELRTPLACIIGMSTTLQRWSADLLDERQQHFLQMIHDSGEQLLNQVEDMIALSQAEAGKIALNLREVSLSHLVQQVFKMLEAQAELNQVELELDLHLFPQNDRLLVDSQRLRQILFNLLSNAIKFTPAGGKVTLRAFVKKSLVSIQVKDTGIGIPEHLISQIFQKFHQLDRGYGRQYQGTGLGLALTKQLVDLHGGWIDVESTVGVGSVFTVWLPLLRSTDTPASIATRSPIDPPKGRVILVEHREEVAEVICDSLTAAGYQVVWMLEGTMAVAQIEVMHPFAVIADVDLPDIKGETLIAELRRNPGTKQVKVIALAPITTQRDFWQSIGADELLHDPITPGQLLQMIMLLAHETPALS